MAQVPAVGRRASGIFTPWRDLGAFEDLFERMGVSPWSGEAAGGASMWAPRADFTEEDGKYVVTAELPGVESKDVDIQADGNTLCIRGEKKVVREESNERVRISERQYGSFERTFVLPATANAEKIKASFDQGVLKVEIEKRPEARGRKIQIASKPKPK
ncbi:MAG: Hsp20/alpha crystallin family protein [Gemmatimonadota bacterium]